MILGVTFGLALWLLASNHGPAGLEPLYLEGLTRGPYRGRVIDAETKAPLAGAAVVAIWERRRRLPMYSRNEFYDAREVVTDADGRFVLDARDIEEKAPEETYLPHFVIYYPGYGFFPDHQLRPTGSLGRIFEGAGTTVELPRLRTRDQRREAVGALPPPAPGRTMPNLLRLINLERVGLGLQPIHQQ
jgi:hypothetical protein